MVVVSDISTGNGSVLTAQVMGESDNSKCRSSGSSGSDINFYWRGNKSFVAATVTVVAVAVQTIPISVVTGGPVREGAAVVILFQ